jgi:hypothetical protein
MKSLNDIPNKNPKIFTKEILEWIENEEFKKIQNDAYCWNRNYPWENFCYFKHGGFYSKDWPIHIYIFSVGIGVDIDYECGGNSSNVFYDFKNYSFEEAYDLMVNYVNSHKN